MTVKRLSLVASKQTKQYCLSEILFTSKISTNHDVPYSFSRLLTVACPKPAF